MEDVCFVGEGIRGLLRERTRRMVEKGVTGGSSDQYQRQWKRWLGFLGTLPSSERPDNVLVEVHDENDKILILMAFVSYLVEELKIRGSKEVGGVLSGLRFEWNRQCLPSAFFEDPRVGAAKQGSRLTTGEMREYACKSKETRKLPVCTEMVSWLRGKLFAGSGYNAQGLYSKGVYLAAAVAFDMGLRPGNVRKVDGNLREDHCIRAGDMIFRIECLGVKEHIGGGEQIRNYLSQEEGGRHVIDQDRLSNVKGVGIQVVTSKTSHRMRAPIQSWEIMRGTVHEEALLEDLCEFMVVSGVREDEPFCSRWAPDRKGVMRRKVVTAKDLSQAVKDAARAFGLPVENFSAKSLRSGFASQMSACGVPREEFLPRGGWSIKSGVPEKHYIHQVVRGAMSTSGGGQGKHLD